jgi:hypothetical protein
MYKRATAIFALAAFALFSSGCMTWRTADLRTMPKPPAQGAAVLSVVKISGERVEFSKSHPGRVKGNIIVGTATNISAGGVSIPLSDVRQIEYKKTNTMGTIILVWGVLSVGCVVLALATGFTIKPFGGWGI